MKVLVTGANGFVGTWLVRALVAAGHEVTGAVGRDAPGPDPDTRGVAWLPLDLLDPRSVTMVAAHAADAVVHLAGVSSVGDSLADPVATWQVNTVGTIRLLEALGVRRQKEAVDPLVLVVSTGEVYGPGETRPRRESDPITPVSPYAASKAAAELGAMELGSRTGLRVIIARPFPHTGPGQSARFVAPAFAARLALAGRTGAPAVKTGSLEPIRDLLDVRDVVAAYLSLLARGTPGTVYNVARGEGHSIGDLFHRLAGLVGHAVIPEFDHALARPVDIPHLVGDATLLRTTTGWSPSWSLDMTLRELLDAQTD
jgi:GDP-4-dehydro-6-deoxy-D-mannose reductase